jgi:hypothetical protein
MKRSLWKLHYTAITAPSLLQCKIIRSTCPDSDNIWNTSNQLFPWWIQPLLHLQHLTFAGCQKLFNLYKSTVVSKSVTMNKYESIQLYLWTWVSILLYTHTHTQFIYLFEVWHKNVVTTLQKLGDEFKSIFYRDVLNFYKGIVILYFPNSLFALDVVIHVLPPLLASYSMYFSFSYMCRVGTHKQ